MAKVPASKHKGNGKGAKLRSKLWFDNPDDPGMSALYIERYLNYGLTRGELQSGKPIIGIAQTGSDLSPCNRHHLDLAHRVREGIREAGAIAFEFPMHPIQETGKRPTAALDRNLAYLGLVEVLYGYPLDGVVLLTGCDKTTPAPQAATEPAAMVSPAADERLVQAARWLRTVNGLAPSCRRQIAGNTSTSSRPPHPRSAIATPWAPPRP
jgi:dihydroxyacid dehydratase/phosphogluconate dehydratase